MKLKVSISPLGNIRESIKKRIEKAIDSEFKKEIGQEVTEDIKINTRRGYGILDGKRIELAPLKDPETILHRKYLEKGNNNTARPYITDLSNLSMSGQLIDSVDFKLKGDDIVIEASGERRPYRKLDGSPSKAEPISNKELSKIHHKGDAGNNLPPRPFIGFRDELKRRILIKLRERIRRSLEVVFNVKRGS
jgi:phage gpG-like protein